MTHTETIDKEQALAECTLQYEHAYKDKEQEFEDIDTKCNAAPEKEPKHHITPSNKSNTCKKAVKHGMKHKKKK